MSPRVTAFAFALLAIVLTFAQDAVPARDWYHGWQYITILAIAIVVMAMHAWRSRREPAALALLGALIVAVAGLLSGLIGPDTVTVVGTPGTVMPLPDLRAAAFFAPATEDTLPRGDANVTLRRPGAGELNVGTRPRPLGLWVLFAQPRPAAYVVVRDASGNRLTITQPNNPSFLSPVMLFRQTQAIHGRDFPLDTFAVPGAHRVVRILYFSPADLAAFRHDATAAAPNQPGAILSVADDAGAQRGITMAGSGRETDIAGLRITVTLGTYPVLQLASAPQPLALIAGAALFLAGSVWALIARRAQYAVVLANVNRSNFTAGVTSEYE